jgi:hypothetical protein
MAENQQSFRVEVTDGPGEFPFLLKAFYLGEIVHFTVEFPGNGGRMYSVKIDTLHAGDRKVFGCIGQLEIKPGKWAQFKGTYNPNSRKGYFILFTIPMEIHPVCMHLVPKDQRICPECGADRMETT